MRDDPPTKSIHTCLRGKNKSPIDRRASCNCVSLVYSGSHQSQTLNSLLDTSCTIVSIKLTVHTTSARLQLRVGVEALSVRSDFGTEYDSSVPHRSPKNRQCGKLLIPWDIVLVPRYADWPIFSYGSVERPELQPSGHRSKLQVSDVIVVKENQRTRGVSKAHVNGLFELRPALAGLFVQAHWNPLTPLPRWHNVSAVRLVVSGITYWHINSVTE